MKTHVTARRCLHRGAYVSDGDEDLDLLDALIRFATRGRLALSVIAIVMFACVATWFAGVWQVGKWIWALV